MFPFRAPTPRTPIAAVLVAAFALVACGGLSTPGNPNSFDASASGSSSASGSTASSGSSSGSMGSSGSASESTRSSGSGYADAGGSPCPPVAPQPGAPCSRMALVCEYGDAVQIGCATLATCSSGGWQLAVPALAEQRVCSWMAPDAGTCPATRGQVPAGQACSSNGLTCPYATGICYCTADHTGAPQIWTCFPSAGCPYPRPRLGELCTIDGQQCDYSICGSSVACTGGIWQQGGGGCHP